MQIDPTKVVIASEKLTGYLLSRTHPIGRYKSAFFLGLGFTLEEPAALASALRTLLIATAEPGEVTEFGQKILARGQILGPNGQFGRILAVWIILSAESVVRFVTVHGRPHIAKHSRSDDQEVKIAPVHPDFCCERCSLSLMGSAGRHLDRLRALGVLR